MFPAPLTSGLNRRPDWHVRDRWSDSLRAATDVGLAAVLFVCPLLMGGRHPIGQFAFVTTVAVTTLIWGLARLLSRDQIRWTWSGAEIILLGAVALVVMQLIPFSASWLDRLSPHLSQLLPMWNNSPAAGASWPHWKYVSLSPESTRGGLSMLVAYVCLFCVTAQRLRRRQEIERLLKAIALAGMAMSLLGLAQYLFGNGRFLWVYAHPSRDTFYAVKGSFANQNHFGHFVALTIGPAMWWLHGESKRTGSAIGRGGWQAHRRRETNLWIGLTIGIGLMLLAAALTFSRGGILAVMLAATMFTSYLAAKRELSRHAVVAIAVVLCIIAAAVTLHGHRLLTDELSTLAAQDLDTLDASRGRRRIWAAVGRAIPQFVCWGSGIGTHRYVYPTYMDEVADVEYTHAENGYLQILLEAGGPGLCLLLCGIGLSGYWLWRSATTPPVRVSEATDGNMWVGAIMASWLVSILHASADFHWYIPACMSVTIMLLAAALRIQALTQPHPLVARELIIPRFSWGAAVFSMAFVSGLTIHERWPPAAASIGWDEYLARSLVATRIESGDGNRSGRQRDVSDIDRSSPEALAGMIVQLDKASAHNPHDARIQLRLAALSLRQFELLQKTADNAMPLSAIRDAAQSGGFATQAELTQWIDKAVGPNRLWLDRALDHSRAAVRLCPLQGLGYVYLSEVAFLAPHELPPPRELLAQAYRARPYDGSVLFANGRERLLENDLAGALAFWKDAFRRGPRLRRQVLENLGDQLTAEELISIFQPNLEGLSDIADYYRETQQIDKLRVVAPILSHRLQQEAPLLSAGEVATLWTQAQFAFHVLDEHDLAAEAAARAVAAVPADFAYRQTLAYRLRQANRLAEALEQFEWLRNRQPDNPHVLEAITNLHHMLHEETRSTATRPNSPVR